MDNRIGMPTPLRFAWTRPLLVFLAAFLCAAPSPAQHEVFDIKLGEPVPNLAVFLDGKYDPAQPPEQKGNDESITVYDVKCFGKKGMLVVKMFHVDSSQHLASPLSGVSSVTWYSREENEISREEFKAGVDAMTNEFMAGYEITAGKNNVCEEWFTDTQERQFCLTSGELMYTYNYMTLQRAAEAAEFLKKRKATK